MTFARFDTGRSAGPCRVRSGVFDRGVPADFTATRLRRGTLVQTNRESATVN